MNGRTVPVWAVAALAGAIVSVVLAVRSIPAAGEQSDKPNVEWINRLVRAKWSEDPENPLKPSEPATDAEFVRRAFLDILGRIPSAEEARQYILSRDSDKKVKLIRRLLYEEPYASRYASYWATIWSDLLVGRNPESRDVNKRALTKWLRDAFASNRPWNEIVYELITATGASSPESLKDDVPFNGAVNFLLAHRGDRATRNVPATSFTTRLFLGVQVQCTQCHDHPFNDRTQKDFWGINAFFQQMDVERVTELTDTGRRVIRYVVLKDRKLYPGDPLFVLYERRNGLVIAAVPRFLDGREIREATDGLNLRVELAKWITSDDNPYFAAAIVNRMWGHFLGKGIVHPVDDLGKHNPPSNPELLYRLAANFKESGYDLKQLIEWITLSEPYGLSSRTNRTNEKDDVYFSHYLLKQMSPDQFFESLMVASEAYKSGVSPEEAYRMRQELKRQFTAVFGNDENTEADTFAGTIPQALLMMNGRLIQRAVSLEKGSYLRRLIDRNRRKYRRGAAARIIDELYLSALSRFPTRKERAGALRLVAQYAARGKEDAAYQDIFWALLNSAEFALIH